MGRLTRVISVVISVCASAAFAHADGNSTTALTPSNTVVLGWNDLGMHCMNEDFSEIMILPPFNTVHAQVIQRGDDPRIVSKGVKIKYSFVKNTTSSDKTNFWDFDEALFGVDLPNDVGLTGNGLKGRMKPTGGNDWNVVGVPLTPVNDNGKLQPYQLAKIRVSADGAVLATTKAVAPVSWEIHCDYCHNTEGISVAKSILRSHDTLHQTNLEAQSESGPVACMNCHAQAPLGTTGTPSLSSAIHSAHASRMDLVTLNNACYACHPGVDTQCFRDVHYTNGVTCVDCHGGMTEVGDPNRSPWVDEPKCSDCHDRKGFEFEQAGTLYRNSKGHGGVHCAACHGSPHAITPTVEPRDNIQAIQWQGHPGTIDTCTVCHDEQPDEKFPHRYFEEDDD